ncbi:MAG TPA: hypothetical protein VLM38_01450 [Blastocatellia bacterium]|nr:hypothetical protein [Blastocatellia bacterium]
MRNLVFALIAMLLLAGRSFAQNDEEIAKLRLYLRVSDKTPITVQKSRALPIGQPLKIFVASGDDPSPAQEVFQLIEEIKRAGKYGTIHVVSDAAGASLFLIQYEVEGKRRQEMTTALSMDPAVGRGRTDYIIKTEVRGYVVARTPSGFEIINRYVRQVVVGERRRELRDAFAKFLKDQFGKVAN